MHGFNGGPGDFLDLSARSMKPRTEGLTHVIDKGLGLRQIEELFETAGDYVDIVKLGWGTSYVTKNLDEKIGLYRSFGVPIVCGGTLFEAVVGRDRLDEYRSWLSSNGFTHVEVSDGTIDLPHGRKLELISELAKDFVVMSEVGSKNADVVYAPYQWVEWMKDELDAGAWKVITEAREGGTAGIFRPTGEMRTGLIDEIVHEIEVGDIIFEAPKEAAQAWFVRRFGPDVNLGNIPPEEVIPLETLRIGLRSDTLKEILLSEHTAFADRV
jgi:phosphosulfolactate synthase